MAIFSCLAGFDLVMFGAASRKEILVGIEAH